MVEALTDFFNFFDFDDLLDSFSDGSWQAVLEFPIVWVVGGLLLGMIAYPKTRNLGTMLSKYASVAVVYSIGGVVLKNSDISTPGPFILLFLLAGGAVGYFFWTKMIMTD